MKRSRLLLMAVAKTAAGFALVSLLLFGSAGTLDYPNARLFLALLFFPMLLVGAVLLARAPRLLEKRLRAREPQPQQLRLIVWAALLFTAGFVAAGLSFRLQWGLLPAWATAAGAAGFVLGYALYAVVLRQNEFLSRSVEIQEGQRVIDSGLYSVVRHPMYTATLLLFLSIPLILGSAPALPIFLLYLPLIARRIAGEEALLERELPGYRAYRQKVRWRLVPFLW